MVKILSQSGNSLADIYDVRGSIAGIDQLETRELPIVHEMGSTIFSERFVTTIRRAISGNVLQNTGINVVIENMPVMPTRILAIAVITDNALRLSRMALMARDPDSGAAGMEVPIWQWDSTNFTPVGMIDLDDATPQVYELLRGTFEASFVPNFTGGSTQGASHVSQIALRGLTTGFGAGTVFVRALIYVAFPFVEGLSSRGLPVPSW